MFPNPQNQAFRIGFGLQIGSHDFLWPQRGPRCTEPPPFLALPSSQVKLRSTSQRSRSVHVKLGIWMGKTARQEDIFLFNNWGGWLTLGGGFNPVEKYESNRKSSPNRGENKKYLSFHHLVHFKIHNYKNNTFSRLVKNGVAMWHTWHILFNMHLGLVLNIRDLLQLVQLRISHNWHPIHGCLGEIFTLQFMVDVLW